MSDCLGALSDPNVRLMVLGITNGCLIPLFFVPLIEKMKARKEARAERVRGTSSITDGESLAAGTDDEGYW